MMFRTSHISLNKLPFLLLFLLISTSSIAQEEEYFLWDNSFYQIYQTAKVKTVTVHTTDYDDSGEISESYVSTIQTFAKNGNLIRDLEYLSADKSEGWSITHTYNKNHQIIRTESSWFDS